ncbi:MAG: DUF294 nucleotidyltransferase-like domain-containing protein [Candidatus Altiarchaeota archaeon]|nr:DUF294 nucleotidyltransferase-like domain-containing protein [Candidatus Altiarchaeota archaeon]
MEKHKNQAVSQAGPVLFETAGTVLPVDAVRKALADISASGRERFTLLGVCRDLKQADNESYRRLMEPGSLALPMRAVEALSHDLDGRVGKAFDAIHLNHQQRGLGSDWSFGTGRDYMDGVGRVLSNFWAEEFVRTGVRHAAGARVSETTENLSRVSDVVLKKTVETAFFMAENEHGRPSADFAVVAIGSYGRREMLPNSDVDLYWVYFKDGKTGGVDRGGMFDHLSAIGNGDFFLKVSGFTEELLKGTGIANHHKRGPKTLDEFKHDLGRLDVCMDMLNSSRVYETGGMFGIVMKTVSDAAFDPKNTHRFISRMIMSRAKETADAGRIMEEDLLGVGGTAISLKYSAGGSRSTAYMNHMGQILDPDLPEVKIRKTGRALGGLAILASLPPRHPLHLKPEEHRLIEAASWQLDSINLDLKLHSPNATSPWNPLLERDLEYLGGLVGIPAAEYKRKVLDKTLRQVDSVWSRMADRYGRSGLYVS